MGVKLFELIPSTEISINSLSGRTIVLDGNLNLYQFLTSIRQRDGSFLTDAQGRVTSHLVGLFNRTAKLMQQGVKLAFVFDGKPPKLKEMVIKKRADLKTEAKIKYQQALVKEDIAEMKKYAKRTTRLTKEMVEEAKTLISALGIPVVQAPSEGEAQAAHMVCKGEAYAVGSQDADCFMFGATRLVKNLTLSPYKKKPGSLAYSTVSPELFEIDEVLNSLGITHDMLICLCMLIGTDYNPGGIKGIGPKTGLKLVKEAQDFGSLFKATNWQNYFDYSWQEVFNQIKNIDVTDDYLLKWARPNPESVKQILVEEHGFSEERVNQSLNKLVDSHNSNQQKGLKEFF